MVILDILTGKVRMEIYNKEVVLNLPA